MSLQRQALFWLGILLGVSLALYVLRDALLPFVAGIVLAYLLDPVADRLQRLGLPRLVATILILGLFVIAFALALVVVVPILGDQAAKFATALPRTVTRLQTIVVQQGSALVERFGGKAAIPDIQDQIGEIVAQGAAWIGGFLRGLWSGGQARVGVVSLLVVTPIVAFYMLVDWNALITRLDGWTPPRHREKVRAIARDIDGAIAGFVRGQSLVALFLTVWYGVGLTLIADLNFGLLIAIVSGLVSFIPYVGSLLGLVLSLGVALVQFWPDFVSVGIVIAVFASGQFIEGNVLTPKVVGEAVGLHPVWLMFALVAFGSLFGFVGLLLAVPLAASIGVLASHGMRAYLGSPLYLGESCIVLPDASGRLIEPEPHER